MPSPQLLLAERGNPLFRVVNRPNAPASEEFAAEELRRHLLAMSGVGPQRRNRERSRGRSGVHTLYVNHAEAAAAAGLDGAKLSLAPEAFHIRTQGGDVHVLGGGPRGVLCGVYELLETLGCRWYTPECAHIPCPERLTLPPLRRTAAPCFEFRDMWVWEGSDPLWWVRNRMNGWYNPVPDYMGGHNEYGLFVHTFDALVPPEEFFDAHPEYFSEVGGQRRRHGGQLCLTNPDVLRLLTGRLLERMRAHPRARIWSVSQNDCAGYCECPGCAAVAAEEGSQAGPILRFVNAVAEATAREFPQTLIDTLAYWYSLDAPRKTVPHPNVRVRLCSINCCMAHGYGTCNHKESARFLKALRGWSRVTRQMYIWHYATNFANYPLPMPDYDELQANLNLYRKKGVYGVFVQGMGEEGGGAETMALRGYVVSRLLWNPNQPVWPLIDGFLAAWCGRAATPVRRYLDVFHARVRQDRALHCSLYDPPTHPLFDGRSLARADAALADGERRVQGAERLRVRLLRHGLAYARLAHVCGTFAIHGRHYRGEATSRDRRHFETMVRDWRRAGLQRLREGAPFEFTANLLRNRLGAHPVEWLRDGRQSAAVVPNLGGRIVEWHALGRQWLAPADPDNHWNAYPMNEGWADFVIQGLYGYYGWAERFQARRTGRGLVLNATVLESLTLTRTVRLRDGGLQVSTRLRNDGRTPVTCALGPSLHLRIPQPFTLRFDSQDGTQSLASEAIPDGLGNSVVFEGGRVPRGAWEVETGSVVVRHAFAGTLQRAVAGRVVAKGILALDLRTPAVALAPGETLTVEQAVSVRPLKA